MSSYVMGHELRELEKILGIDQLKDVTIRMPLDSVVTAEVTFVLKEEVVRDVLALLRDGEWKSVSE